MALAHSIGKPAGIKSYVNQTNKISWIVQCTYFECHRRLYVSTYMSRTHTVVNLLSLFGIPVEFQLVVGLENKGCTRTHFSLANFHRSTWLKCWTRMFCCSCVRCRSTRLEMPFLLACLVGSHVIWNCLATKLFCFKSTSGIFSKTFRWVSYRYNYDMLRKICQNCGKTILKVK